MNVDVEALQSYVRFYLAVVSQLNGAWQTALSLQSQAKEMLKPFAGTLGPVESGALQAALQPPPPTPKALLQLWLPEDEAQLSGLTDIYEVVGRFTFQGEGNRNIGSVQTAVALTRNELHAQHNRIQALAELPGYALTAADRLQAQEVQNSQSAMADKARRFEELSNNLKQRAQQTLDAVANVELPKVADPRTAAEEYNGYRLRISQVYLTCLPYWKKALEELCEFSGCETPESWPDTLPFAEEVPEELLNIPSADSPELERAQGQLQALDDELDRIRQGKDESQVAVGRLEADLGALAHDRQTRDLALQRASGIVELAGFQRDLEQARLTLASLENQKAGRLAQLGDMKEEQKRAEHQFGLNDQQIVALSANITQLESELDDEHKQEPMLFGKQDWSTRVEALQSDHAARSAEVAQLRDRQNNIKVALSSLAVKIQNEQSQCEMVDRWLADTNAKKAFIKREIARVGEALGTARPAVIPDVESAEAHYAEESQKRGEVDERDRRIRAEIRRQKEESARLVARSKQAGLERERAQGYLHSAQIATTQGRAEAMKQLASRRVAAVESHIKEVLLGVQSAAQQVDGLYIEPCRQLALREEKQGEAPSELVRRSAQELQTVVEHLQRDLVPELLAQDAGLSQIQREFCDAAEDACRAAWGAVIGRAAS